jgi:hypothetical protein
MPAFKYKVREQVHRLGDSYTQQVDEALNGYGADGYELVSVVVVPSMKTANEIHEIWYLKKQTEVE